MATEKKEASKNDKEPQKSAEPLSKTRKQKLKDRHDTKLLYFWGGIILILMAKVFNDGRFNHELEETLFALGVALVFLATIYHWVESGRLKPKKGTAFGVIYKWFDIPVDPKEKEEEEKAQALALKEEKRRKKEAKARLLEERQAEMDEKSSNRKAPLKEEDLFEKEEEEIDEDLTPSPEEKEEAEDEAAKPEEMAEGEKASLEEEGPTEEIFSPDEEKRDEKGNPFEVKGNQ